MRRRHTLKHSVLRLLCVVLGLILTVMLSATLYFQHLLDQINYVDHEATPSLSQQELDQYLATEVLELSTSTAPDAGDISFSEHDIQIGGKGSDIINILLIGQDRREGENRARSDTMILCTFNKDSKQLIMTSFLRDLYVEIPGYQNNRINAAYAAGGMPLLNKTLEENFGIQVDGNIEVDFTQFSRIIDLMGGVTMELRQDEADAINESIPGDLTAGTQWLTGQQALAYSRIRNLDGDGDFSRTNRQRKVITALLEAYKDADLTAILGLFADALPMISTDMSEMELLRYTVELFPLLGSADIISQRIPADGTYTDKSINGMSVLVADMDATRQLLSESLLGS